MATEHHHAPVYSSLTTPKRYAIAGIGAAGAGIFCFMITDMLHVFKSCRGYNLTTSVLCNVHSGIQYLGMTLYAVFVILIIISLVLQVRSPPPKPHHHTDHKH
jgi:hypothetical protein